MENELSHKIIKAALEVHKTLGGPGLLESVYEEAFCYELRIHGLAVQRQVPIPITYKGNELGSPLIIDLLVENRIIIEVKATIEMHPVFESQLLTYLRLTGYKLGMLINFGEGQLKNGISRVVNNL